MAAQLVHKVIKCRTSAGAGDAVRSWVENGYDCTAFHDVIESGDFIVLVYNKPSIYDGQGWVHFVSDQPVE